MTYQFVECCIFGYNLTGLLSSANTLVRRAMEKRRGDMELLDKREMQLTLVRWWGQTTASHLELTVIISFQKKKTRSEKIYLVSNVKP